jgi:hypothetical protein
MAKSDELKPRGILGDIDPSPTAHDHISSAKPGEPRDSGETEAMTGDETEHAMTGGSRHDRTEHAGSRDVTEGVTGGTGTEVGGTRNLRQGTGATGGDIGNRPE